MIILISDPHVGPSGTLNKGIDAQVRLKACIDDINLNMHDASLCVFMGDLVENPNDDAYQAFKACLSELNMPSYLMIGNHDYREGFKRYFPDIQSDEHGYIQFVADDLYKRLIFLDTAEPWAPHGYLCHDRRKWLISQLDSCPLEKPIYIFMHHPPCSIGLSIDKSKLQNANAFLSIIKPYPNIAGIFTGHTHHPCHVMWHGYPVYVIGSSFYNTTLSCFVNSVEERWRESRQRRFMSPAYYAVVSFNKHTTAVHHHDFLYGGNADRELHPDWF